MDSKIEETQTSLASIRAQYESGVLDADVFNTTRFSLLKEGLVQVAEACGVSLKCEWDDRNQEFRFSPHKINPMVKSELHSNYGAFARVLNEHNPHCGSQAIIVAEDYSGGANLNKHDTEKLIQGFTMEKIQKKETDIPSFPMHIGKGHSWLEVPTNLLVDLGIAGLISKYSYQSNYSAFLEKDRDFDIFLDAMKVRGYDFTREVKRVDERYDAIRSKSSYDCTKLPVIKLGDEISVPSGMGGVFCGEVTSLDALDSVVGLTVTHGGPDWNGHKTGGNILASNFYSPLYAGNEKPSIHSEPARKLDGDSASLLELVKELNETMDEEDCSWGDFRIKGDSLFEHYGKEFVPSDGLTKAKSDEILLAAAYSNGATLGRDLMQANVPFAPEIILAGVQQRKGVKL